MCAGVGWQCHVGSRPEPNRARARPMACTETAARRQNVVRLWQQLAFFTRTMRGAIGHGIAVIPGTTNEGHKDYGRRTKIPLARAATLSSAADLVCEWAYRRGPRHRRRHEADRGRVDGDGSHRARTTGNAEMAVRETRNDGKWSQNLPIPGDS